MSAAVRQTAIRAITLSAPDDVDGWRDIARGLAGAGVPPEQLMWDVAGAAPSLFGENPPAPQSGAPLTVPRTFWPLVGTALLHRDPERFALGYSLLWGLTRGEIAMSDAAHPLIHRLEALAKSVRRDIHKMRAFVRFRVVEDDDGSHAGPLAGPRYVAWFEPEHHIVRRNAGFFRERFANMRWSILTPDLSIHWDGKLLSESVGAQRGDAPGGDPVEDVWKRYYASIFNPARVKIGAMTKEMPRKYWHNMPETALIPGLIAAAQARSSTMVAAAPDAASARSPAPDSIALLRTEAMGCARCPLAGPATQTVFGEGPVDARLMLVGEQPGDNEDLAGQVFVGPAGQLLDAILADAGIDRARLYLTNAVKHFKHELRGKRRLHATPNVGEIDACRWWVDQERRIVRPAVTLTLGASALRSVMGKPLPVGKNRGAALTAPDGGVVHASWHPSAILRAVDDAAAQQMRAELTADLAAAWAHTVA